MFFKDGGIVCSNKLLQGLCCQRLFIFPFFHRMLVKSIEACSQGYGQQDFGSLTDLNRGVGVFLFAIVG